MNDPPTAVHALGHVSAPLGELAQHRLGRVVPFDDDGCARVWVDEPDLGDHLALSLTQPRLYGANDPMVLTRPVRVLAELAVHLRPADRDVVVRELSRLGTTTTAGGFDAATLEGLATGTAEVGGTGPDRADGRPRPVGRRSVLTTPSTPADPAGFEETG